MGFLSLSLCCLQPKKVPTVPKISQRRSVNAPHPNTASDAPGKTKRAWEDHPNLPSGGAFLLEMSFFFKQ